MTSPGIISNRLTSEQLAQVAVGDKVLIEIHRSGWRGPEFSTALVTRLTKSQIVCETQTSRGPTESKFRIKDGRRVGDSVASSAWAELVDPDHQLTVRLLGNARSERLKQTIDSLHLKWTRKPADLDVLRQLHTSIGEYLDAESTS